jgi:hypothetical protein
MAIETDYNVGFVAKLTAEEKQIQQNYRPVIGVHKWFARRPGALFRGLLLAEFTNGGSLAQSYYQSHSISGVTIADPFMGGGTTLFEANRMGCNVVGFDINPMAFWVVRQELVAVDRRALRAAAQAVIADVTCEVEELYRTRCLTCQGAVPVKYFLWVKQQRCGECRKDLDLFPGYLIAGNARHPNFVLHCPACKNLVEIAHLPPRGETVDCSRCQASFDWATGSATRNRYTCPWCDHQGRYPIELRAEGPPRHRLLGMEYHCERCGPSHQGRFFKTPDAEDLARLERAAEILRAHDRLELPTDDIPDGDETKRLHRWGYARYQEMFNERQLLSLGLLLRRIKQVPDVGARHALATVFSDSLRYQNMLCRYDTYALKCQDIFSVHGFPVGLIQCENNVLGIPGVGSGSFTHFVEKYDRAKAYCERPFETIKTKSRKQLCATPGESIDARLVTRPEELTGGRKALLVAGSIEDVAFAPATFDAVFTDPPYFDNVQYAELMDFCYAWLRLFLAEEIPQFRNGSTRSPRELTGNDTTGKDLAHFTEGLSGVFCHAARCLKAGAPFVFTYHHRTLEAYAPVVVAILDADLQCTATLPCPAEMTASLHIYGTGSSVMDTIVVCRAANDGPIEAAMGRDDLRDCLLRDQTALAEGGIPCSRGDLCCLAFGHLARAAIQSLHKAWDASCSVERKLARAGLVLQELFLRCDVGGVIREVANDPIHDQALCSASEALQPSLFDEIGQCRE